MSASESKWTFAQKFYVDFNVTASELGSQLDALKGGLDVPLATMQAITSDLSRLTKSLSDATGSLPSYDQRQCELQLKTLEKSAEELRGASASTPKFSFRRKATKTKPSTEHASVVGPPPAKAKPQPTLIESTKTLAAFSHRYLSTLDVHSPNSAEVSISDLDNCIVNLLPADEDHAKITAFHVQRVLRSVILLPQIAGSIIFYDLSECVIVVGCHQFRMHNSTAVDVYLESRADPIIENCSDIRFAAYPSSLVHGSVQDSKHLDVKDFSHILPTPSPNWSMLLEERWEKSWPVFPLQNQVLREELKRMLTRSRSPENGLRK